MKTNLSNPSDHQNASMGQNGYREITDAAISPAGEVYVALIAKVDSTLTSWDNDFPADNSPETSGTDLIMDKNQAEFGRFKNVVVATGGRVWGYFGS